MKDLTLPPPWPPATPNRYFIDDDLDAYFREVADHLGMAPTGS